MKNRRAVKPTRKDYGDDLFFPPAGCEPEDFQDLCLYRPDPDGPLYFHMEGRIHISVDEGYHRTWVDEAFDTLTAWVGFLVCLIIFIFAAGFIWSLFQ